MAAVTIREGVRYGVSLLGYFIVLSLVGGIALGIGIALASLDSGIATLIGFLILLAGIVVFYAGTLGVGYKLIADGVARGVRSVNTPTAEVEESGPGSDGGLFDALTGPVEQSSSTTEPSERGQERRRREQVNADE